MHLHHFDRREAHREEHHHPEGQLFILTRGSASFRTEDGAWLMLPGRFCWVPPGQRHGTATNGPVAGISLFLAAEDCTALPARARVLMTDDFMRELLIRLAAAPGRANLLTVLMDEITAAKDEDLHLPAAMEPRLTRLLAQIAADPADDRDLDTIARDLGIGKRTLVRRLRAETGLSYLEWRGRARILKAVALLENGVSVTEVAFAVGYSNVSAFIRIFQTYLGMTPGAFRRAG